jgi:hypothetical protein
VLPDVDEAEVVLHEGGHEHDRGDEGGRERAEDRVLGRLSEPRAPPVSGVRPGDGCVDGQPEADDERGAPELRH